MGSTYTHLSIHERRQLFHWRHEQDWSARKIAHALGRSHTSISREIKRHMCETYVPCYYPNPAQHDYGMMTRRRGQRQLGRQKNKQRGQLDQSAPADHGIDKPRQQRGNAKTRTSTRPQTPWSATSRPMLPLPRHRSAESRPTFAAKGPPSSRRL